jgi:ATP-dependent helicase/DNAse subunit B
MLASLRLNGARTSATGVQAFAACPYKHLLARGFRLREWTEPAHVYQLDSGAWGGLYHDAARRLFEWLRETEQLPLRRERVPAVEPELFRFVEEAGQALLDEGAIRNAALLEPAKGRVRQELAELLDREAEPDPDGFVPALFEQRYEGLAVDLGDGRTVTFAGSLDRVDVRESPKAVRVVDYKTGKYPWKEDEQFRGGRELQLALYNEAVRQLVPGASVAEARYYHTTAAARFKAKACPATPEVEETLRRVLRALDDTARAGVFAPVADTCDYCAFVGVCGSFREARARRKQQDPRLAVFRAIREIP